ncbi:MAG: UDP-N-acetylmuramate dehydrogenase [Bdellovibrionales bacterium]|nr:UDP-N-acetylmuramate dehydrogenase [Bdellovibrionales bacterium]
MNNSCVTEAEQKLEDEVSVLAGIKVRNVKDARRFTTFFIGGEIRRLIEVNSESEIRSVMGALKAVGARIRYLGAGSNLLLGPCVQDWVIKLGRGFRSLNVSGNSKTLEVGASMPLMTLCREVASRGLSGLEFAGGIPASFGGACRMNAGAHGGQICDVLRSITFIDSQGVISRVSVDELEFSYRRCSLPHDALILSATIELAEASPERVIARQRECLAQRKAAQPLALPSAGSVFRNPANERTAGVLIESCGLKGMKFGAAQISEKHGNWIVNPSRQATSEDVMKLIALCQREVSGSYSIDLVPELVVWDVPQ